MENQGFIVLHRKIFNHPIWKNSGLVHLFVTLILLACHKEERFLWNGKEETLKRGQLLTGRFKLAEILHTSPNTIKDRLKVLQNLGIITIKSTNKFSVITIVKYSQYQDKKDKDTTKDTNQTPTRHQQDTTYNNDNNINNKSEAKAPDVNSLMGVFKKLVNPNLNFANKTERKACENLLKDYSLKDITENLELIQEHQKKGTPYLPVITTPYEMYTKWAKLEIFFNKHQ